VFQTRILHRCVPVVLAMLLAACTDTNAPPPLPAALDPQLNLLTLPAGCDPVRAFELIGQLYTDDQVIRELRRKLGAALKQINTSSDKARTAALLIVEQIGDDANSGKLADPNGAQPPTTQEAAFELSNIVLVCFGQEPIPEEAVAAFGTGGAVEVVEGDEGAEVITANEQAGMDIPAGAFEGTGVVTITPNTAEALTNTCLGAAGAKVRQTSQCYHFDNTAVPAGQKYATPVLKAVCAYAVGPGGGQASDEAEHDNQALATADPADPTKLEVLERVLTTFSGRLHCPDEVLVASNGIGARLFGRAWPAVQSVVAKVTRPFRPTIAYAADGVGGFTDHDSNWRLIERRPDAKHDASSPFSLNGSEVRAGSSIGINASAVVNAGGGMISSLTARYYLSNDNAITTGDVQLGPDITIGALRPGETKAIAATTRLIPAGTAAGDKFIGLLLDPGTTAFPESNVANNAVATGITITDPPCTNGSSADCNPTGATLSPASAFVDPSPPVGYKQCAGFINTPSDDVRWDWENNCLPFRSGPLFVRVFDEAGQIIAGARIHDGVAFPAIWTSPSGLNYSADSFEGEGLLDRVSMPADGGGVTDNPWEGGVSLGWHGSDISYCGCGRPPEGVGTCNDIFTTNAANTRVLYVGGNSTNHDYEAVWGPPGPKNTCSLSSEAVRVRVGIYADITVSPSLSRAFSNIGVSRGLVAGPTQAALCSAIPNGATTATQRPAACREPARAPLRRRP
jgi:hypothetical protein